MTASVDSALRLLQIVGLSLPAVVLYMDVLVEMYMSIRRVTFPDLEAKEGNKHTLVPDRYAGRLTESGSQIDFLFALLSLVGLLVSGLLLVVYVILLHPVVYQAGLIVLVVSYSLLVVSCLLLVRIIVQNIGYD